MSLLTSSCVCAQEAEIGGETCFPLIDRKIKLRAGEALVFSNLHRRGAPNFFSMHGSCEVISKQDEKWVANIWFRTPPQQGG